MHLFGPLPPPGVWVGPKSCQLSWILKPGKVTYQDLEDFCYFVVPRRMWLLKTAFPVYLNHWGSFWLSVSVNVFCTHVINTYPRSLFCITCTLACDLGCSCPVFRESLPVRNLFVHNSSRLLYLSVVKATGSRFCFLAVYGGTHLPYIPSVLWKAWGDSRWASSWPRHGGLINRLVLESVMFLWLCLFCFFFFLFSFASEFYGVYKLLSGSSIMMAPYF